MHSSRSPVVSEHLHSSLRTTSSGWKMARLCRPGVEHLEHRRVVHQPCMAGLSMAKERLEGLFRGCRLSPFATSGSLGRSCASTYDPIISDPNKELNTDGVPDVEICVPCSICSGSLSHLPPLSLQAISQLPEFIKGVREAQNISHKSRRASRTPSRRVRRLCEGVLGDPRRTTPLCLGCHCHPGHTVEAMLVALPARRRRRCRGRKAAGHAS